MVGQFDWNHTKNLFSWSTVVSSPFGFFHDGKVLLHKNRMGGVQPCAYLVLFPDHDLFTGVGKWVRPDGHKTPPLYAKNT